MSGRRGQYSRHKKMSSEQRAKKEERNNRRGRDSVVVRADKEARFGNKVIPGERA